MSGHHRSLPLYCVIGADALSRAGNAMTTIAIPLIVLNQGYSAAEVGLSSAAASLPIVIVVVSLASPIWPYTSTQSAS